MEWRGSLRVEVTEPKRRSTPNGTRSTSTTPAETTLTTPAPISDTEGKSWLLETMKNIDMKAVEEHFSKVVEDSEGGLCCEPYLVTERVVSQQALREYCEHSAYENSPFTLRFLELSDDGKLWIVELPTDVHEGIAGKFDRVFGYACPALDDFLGSWGHATIVVNGEKKEPDKSYGPGRNVPNSVRPHALQGAGWLTFVVEVGSSQSWPSLRGRARMWYDYPGIQYILLIKVDDQATSLLYEFYDASVNPLVLNDLPAVTLMSFYYDPTGGAQENITLDSRRLLGIPPGLAGTPPPPLPNGVPAIVTIDLRLVLHKVNHTL
jgi:hypothetical protein